MAFSGVYSFTVTRDDIVRTAMKFIKKLGEEETPTNQETVDCQLVLNMMCKQWMGKADFAPGLKMWTRKRGNLFLSNSTGQYAIGATGSANWTSDTFVKPTLTSASAVSSTTIVVSSSNGIANGYYIGIKQTDGSLFWTTVNGAPSGNTITLTTGLSVGAASGAQVFSYQTKQIQPIQLETCVLRDTFGQDIPMRFLTLQEYEHSTEKVNPNFISDPYAIYFEQRIDSGVGQSNGLLFTDVAGASDVTKWLHMVFLSEVSDFVNSTDEPEYPKQYFMALCWGLAKQICPMFDGIWTQEMEQNFREALAMAREQNGETTALFFQPGNE